MAKAFQNTSPFQGWKQFKDDSGDEYRAEYQGCEIWDVYSKNGDSFVFEGKTQASSRARCRTIYNAWLHTAYRD